MDYKHLVDYGWELKNTPEQFMNEAIYKEDFTFEQAKREFDRLMAETLKSYSDRINQAKVRFQSFESEYNNFLEKKRNREVKF